MHLKWMQQKVLYSKMAKTKEQVIDLHNKNQEQGAKTYGAAWLNETEKIVTLCKDLGISVYDPSIRALCSTMVLKLLDERSKRIKLEGR